MDCLKIANTLRIEHKENLNEMSSFHFDSEWEQSTADKVEIDNIFTELSDKSLEESRKSKESEKEKSCSGEGCVPIPPHLLK